MEENDFALRLHEARVMSGLSMEELAAYTEYAITKQSISRYEKGIMRPKHYALQTLARALGVSEKYFSAEGICIDLPMLRTTSQDQLTDENLHAIEVRLSFWAEHYLNQEREIGFTTSFKNPLENISVSTSDDVVRAANELREQWRCGDGPLPFLLRLMERKGIRILSTSLPEGILGLSTWADGKYPIVVLDMRQNRTTTERLRFTAAHELAHLLLGVSEKSSLSVEKCCDKFASYFLFPQKTFFEEMGCKKRTMLALEELIDLKEIYGMSIASLVHEAWDFEVITREHYDWWFDNMIKKNPLEKNWGEYPYIESVGREKRVSDILESRKLMNN